METNNVFVFPSKEKESDLDTLSAAWMNAKKAEKKANEERVQIEEKIIALIGSKEEGSTTAKTDFFKVTTTGALDRKIDDDRALFEELPEEFAKRLLKWKADLSITELRYLQNNEPAIYKIVEKHLTTKPRKVGVKVEAI